MPFVLGGSFKSPNAARTDEEFAFLRAVESSDVTTVLRLLDNNPSLNADVIDALGRSALRLAVRNENAELVHLLLELCNSNNIQQAVLQAISEDHDTIAELILKHPNYLQICHERKRLGDTDGFYKTEAESQFSTDITPLNLAAQKNNFAIVQLLLQRGERIQKPDKVGCGCTDCRNRMKFDQLRVAYFRLNAYRGLASEAYVSLSSDDPLLAAFQLAKELRRLSIDEVHFKKEYKDLANQLSDFVVKLLDRVWTQDELKTVLDEKVPSDCNKIGKLSRLELALQNKEKKFVAHASVQQYLDEIWHHGLGKMFTNGAVNRLFFQLALTIAYPFIFIAYLIVPNWKWSQLAKQPMVKFTGHTVSFFIFLMLIVIFCSESMVRVSNKRTLKTNANDIAAEYQTYRKILGEQTVPFGEDFPLRPCDPTITEILLTIWVVGMVVLELQKITNSGAMAHFRDLYNIVDFFLLVVYIATLFLFYWTMTMTHEALTELRGKNASMLLQNPNETNRHLYWLNTDRRLWNKLDPVILAEGLFAMANIVSFSRIFYLLPANEILGPMQISLRRMINDIIKFLVIVMCILAGFIVSLRNLYMWYGNKFSKSLGNRPVPQNVTNAATSFYNIRVQFMTVFWWIYGRGPMNQAIDLPPEYKNSQITQQTGSSVVALYHIAIIILMMNMLIAMMTRTFEKIVKDVDIEWKYARSLLYMEYIRDSCVPAIPINMLKLLHDLIAWMVSRVRRLKKEPEPIMLAACNRRRLACYDSTTCRSDNQRYVKRFRITKDFLQGCRNLEASNKQPNYKDIVQIIVQRYIFDLQREQEIKRGKLEEVRENVHQTKLELLELLDNREANLWHLNRNLQMVSSELSSVMPHTLPSDRDRRKRQFQRAAPFRPHKD